MFLIWLAQFSHYFSSVITSPYNAVFSGVISNQQNTKRLQTFVSFTYFVSQILSMHSEPWDPHRGFVPGSRGGTSLPQTPALPSLKKQIPGYAPCLHSAELLLKPVARSVCCSMTKAQRVTV